MTFEKELHINVLELKAVFFGLKSLCNEFQDGHIRVRIDNTTAVAYVNNMGGVKSIQCDLVAQEIWNWCCSRRIWISAEHIPGSENSVADRKSRVFKDDTEWMLSVGVFEKIVEIYGPVEIDLFASRLNKQCSKYVSWQPDPEAFHIDALTLSWEPLKFYAFPPFSLVGKVLAKILLDQAEGLVIVPLWTTCRVSGVRSVAEEYRLTLPNSSWRPRETELSRSINAILRDGWFFAIGSSVIPIIKRR